MFLVDLEVRIKRCRSVHKERGKLTTLNFSSKFIQNYCDAFNEYYENYRITYVNRCFRIENIQKITSVVVPEFLFLYAYSFLGVEKVLHWYSECFYQITNSAFSASGVSLKRDKEKYLNKLPSKDWITLVDNVTPSLSVGNAIDREIKQFFSSRSSHEEIYFRKFISDKNWSFFNKEFSRGIDDWKGSIINTSAETIHAHSSLLHHFISVFEKERHNKSQSRNLENDLKKVVRFNIKQNKVIQVGLNKIFYGAPGTGKSHRVDSLVNAINSDNVIRTVFHSETQQSDFIGCLKPCVGSKGVTYEFQPGPFSEIYKRAWNKPGEEFYLVIEEINRAPAAAAFGEVFQLLDRDSNGRGVYDISAVDPMHEQWLQQEMPGWNNKIRMPGNLTLYATMNSSDQGVFPLDTAFKRRWTFEYFPIDFSNCPKGNVYYNHDRSLEIKTWKEFAEKINECLAEEGIPEDRHLGPWFVQDSELSPQNNLSPVLTGKVFLYLWDDVLRHGDRTKVFLDKIKTYGELVSRYKKQKNVFSDDLIGKLK